MSAYNSIAHLFDTECSFRESGEQVARRGRLYIQKPFETDLWAHLFSKPVYHEGSRKTLFRTIASKNQDVPFPKIVDATISSNCGIGQLWNARAEIPCEGPVICLRNVYLFMRLDLRKLVLRTAQLHLRHTASQVGCRVHNRW